MIFFFNYKLIGVVLHMPVKISLRIVGLKPMVIHVVHTVMLLLKKLKPWSGVLKTMNGAVLLIPTVKFFYNPFISINIIKIKHNIIQNRQW